MRTNLSARIAFDAQVLLDFMSRVRRHGNRCHRTMLRAQSAAEAIRRHIVANERKTFARRTTALQMRFVFIAKISERGDDRIGCSLPESAQTSLAVLPCQGFEFSEMLALRLARAQTIQDFQHALGANAT